MNISSCIELEFYSFFCRKYLQYNLIFTFVKDNSWILCKLFSARYSSKCVCYSVNKIVFMLEHLLVLWTYDTLIISGICHYTVVFTLLDTLFQLLSFLVHELFKVFWNTVYFHINTYFCFNFYFIYIVLCCICMKRVRCYRWQTLSYWMFVLRCLFLLNIYTQSLHDKVYLFNRKHIFWDTNTWLPTECMYFETQIYDL